MWSFAKSVIFGTLAGASPLLVITIFLALMMLPEGVSGDGHLFPSLWLAVLPLIVTTPIVLAASTIVGLPLTFFLRRQGWESGEVYITVGAAVGFVIPIAGLLIMDAPSGYWMSILGAISGVSVVRTFGAMCGVD